MQDEERFERLLEVLADLQDANEGGTPILVEGLRDITSLRLLGLKGEIFALNAGTSLHQRAETLAAGATLVILLTDWDRKGDQLFDAMRDRLAANGVRTDGTFREKIQLWMRPPVKDVESLASYVGRNLARYHGKDLADLSSG